MNSDQRIAIESALREHRAILGLEERLVIRNPDGADQFCEEIALLVEAVLDGESFGTAPLSSGTVDSATCSECGRVLGAEGDTDVA